MTEGEARDNDIVVFGATGFTGKLVCDYLAKHAGPKVRWSIAGRNAEKLAAIQASLDGEACPPSDVIVASIDDATSLDALAGSTRVVLTTVGPYVKYGEPVVAACVRQGADYVDITGEPPFVSDVIARYGDAARDKQLRIVSCCGFDSIPHDLGAYFTAGLLPSDQPMTIEGFVQASGQFSGGTWHSAIEIMSDASKKGGKKKRAPLPDGRKVGSTRSSIRYEKKLERWVVPMPTIDPVIVKRTAAGLSRFGPDFRYGHFLRMRSLLKVTGLVAGVGSVFALAQLPPTRALLRKLKSPGDGPSEEERANGFFSVKFIGRAGDHEVITEVRGGDPGYGETAKMLSESALCLAKDRALLPERFGVLTPALAMGDVLLDRLQKQGITFSVLKRTPEPSPS